MIDFQLFGGTGAMFHCADEQQLRGHLSTAVDEAMRARNVAGITQPLAGGEPRMGPRGQRFLELKMLAPLPLRELNFSRRVVLDLGRSEPSDYGDHQGEQVFLVRPEFQPGESEDEPGSYGVAEADTRWIWQLAGEALAAAQARNRGRS